MPRTRILDDDTVLDHAIALFWRRGYAGTSIRDVSEASGLGAAALYHRFGDKDGLFVEALRRYAEEGPAERMARFSALADPLAAVSGFLHELADLSISDPERRGCFLVNTALDGAATVPGARGLARARLDEMKDFFRAQVCRAEAAGRLSPDADPDALAESLLACALAMRVLARIDPDPGRLRRLVDAALAPLLPREARPPHRPPSLSGKGAPAP
ncbi:TetR/AcrR family transcriptional regulator [Oleispirillum naphthae]|uniref:TetR/AcrR family transcriptional regulator n=1 Tax=Oleispirillum naphthae TaxID=2838853 RepID=UPI0030822B4F